MMFKRLRQLFRGDGSEDGISAVEFAMVTPMLMLLVLGGMDFGQCFYIKYIITNASREGARYSAKYTGSSCPTSQAISDYVKSSSGLNYNSFNLSNLVVSGSYSGVAPDETVTVTVQADKNWWVLSGMLGLANPTTLTASTAMTVESP